MDITLTPTLKPDFKAALTSQSSPDKLLSGWAEVYEHSYRSLEEAEKSSLPEADVQDPEDLAPSEDSAQAVYQGWMTQLLWIDPKEPQGRSVEEGALPNISDVLCPEKHPASFSSEVSSEDMLLSLPLKQQETPLALNSLHFDNMMIQDSPADHVDLSPLIVSEIETSEDIDASSHASHAEPFRVSQGPEQPQEDHLSSGQQSLGQHTETLTQSLIVPRAEEAGFADQINRVSFEPSTSWQMSPVVAQTLSHLKFHLREGVHRFTIHLTPEDLGHIQVQLDVHPDRHIALHMHTSNAETLTLLKDQTLALQKIFEEAHFIAEKHHLQFSWQDPQKQHHQHSSRLFMPQPKAFYPAEDSRLTLPPAWSHPSPAHMGSSLYSLLI